MDGDNSGGGSTFEFFFWMMVIGLVGFAIMCVAAGADQAVMR